MIAASKTVWQTACSIQCVTTTFYNRCNQWSSDEQAYALLGQKCAWIDILGSQKNCLFLNCIAGLNHHHVISREITSLSERNYRLTRVELLTLSMKRSNCYCDINMQKHATATCMLETRNKKKKVEKRD